MLPDRPPRPPPRERTFAQLFPWRNIRRAVMLILLIVAIVMIKRSTGPLLSRVGEMWGPPPSGPRSSSRPRAPGDGYEIRLGPGLAPRAPATDAR